MAAPNSSINNQQLHYSVNVQGNLAHLVQFACLQDFYFVMEFLSLLSFELAGTKNVIDACVKLKVKRLIYTSSPSVVFDGVHGIINGDESLPYPPKVLTRLNFKVLKTTLSNINACLYFLLHERNII